jgi:hypothetical protein
LSLEVELGETSWVLMIGCSIIQIKENSQDHQGLVALILGFAQIFERLIKFNKHAALEEITCWPKHELFFTHLRVWLCSIDNFLSIRQIESALRNLSDVEFWNSRFQTDLLLVLVKWWQKFSEIGRQEFEKLILAGPSGMPVEQGVDPEKRHLYAKLNRLQWLVNQQCQFTFDVNAEIDSIRRDVPDWEPGLAEVLTEPKEYGARSIPEDKGFDELLNIPISEILQTAYSIRANSCRILVDRNPFSGLSESRPDWAFEALLNAKDRGEILFQAWEIFLSVESRKEDEPSFSEKIASHLIALPFLKMPEERLRRLVTAVSDWISKIADHWKDKFPCVFQDLIDNLVEIVAKKPFDSVHYNTNQGILGQAVNSCSGKLVRALFTDPRIREFKPGPGESLPVECLSRLQKRIEKLLITSEKGGLYALVEISFKLPFLFYTARDWTENHILKWLEARGSERDAILGGLMMLKVPEIGYELVLKLKPDLISFTKENSRMRSENPLTPSVIFLSCWFIVPEETGTRMISAEEMKDLLVNTDDDFRAVVVREMKRCLEGQGYQQRVDDIVALLEKAWPLEISAKTPKASVELFELAFVREETFIKVAIAVLPLLAFTNGEIPTLDIDSSKFKDILKHYPKRVIDLLNAVVPENVGLWRLYDMDSIIQSAMEVDFSLQKDPNYLELVRKWNSSPAFSQTR